MRYQKPPHVRVLYQGFVLSISSLLFMMTCYGTSSEASIFSSKHHDFKVKTILNNLDNPWGLRLYKS